MKTIYCFNNGGSPGWYSALAMCEDGHVVGYHICSDPGFMKSDLGISGDWSGKHAGYDAHCGFGNWKLEWVEDPKNHSGVQAAYALNQELSKAAKSAVSL